MTLRKILNEYRMLKPVKVIAKIVFESLYGLTGEDRWLKLLRDHTATPIGVILDVGSSGGHYLRKAARFFPKAEFHHFEPRPEAAKRLEATIRDLKTNSTVHHLALSDSTGNTEFAIMDYGDASSLIVTGVGSTASVVKVITIATDRLDNAIGGTRPIGLLKIDVEGAELKVLEGGPDALSRAQNLQVEITPLRHVGGHRETLKIFEIVFRAGFDLVDSSDSNYLFSKDPGVLAFFGGSTAPRAE